MHKRVAPPNDGRTQARLNPGGGRHFWALPRVAPELGSEADLADRIRTEYEEHAATVVAEDDSPDGRDGARRR